MIFGIAFKVLTVTAAAILAGKTIGGLFSSPEDDSPEKIGGALGGIIGLGAVLASKDSDVDNTYTDF